MNKIICFNGAPRTGKDTGAEYLRDNRGWLLWSISYHLKQQVSRIYKISIQALEQGKATPCPRLHWRTPRDAYIAHGQMMKDFHGDDFWINRVVEGIKLTNLTFHIISDVGFQAEINRLIEEFGSDNILLIYLSRDGCSYEKDSRSKVRPFHPHKSNTSLSVRFVNNDSDIDHYFKTLDEVVDEWISAP